MDIDAQKKTINILYIVLIISTVLSFVPQETAQLLSLVLVGIVLIAAYIYRSRDDVNGLMFNHMTYLIGTIWIGTGFIMLGAIGAGAWIYYQGDHTLIEEMVGQLQSGVMISEQDLNNLMMSYMAANKNLLITSSIVLIGPGVLYFAYRVANGFSRAAKGYRIAKPHSWL